MKYYTHITHYFDQTVKNFPDAIAIKEDDISISFSALWEQSLCMAYHINKTIAVKNHIVAVYLEKGVHSILSDIATNFSANAYMNLDIKAPSARTQAILEHIKPSLIITTSILAKEIQELCPNIAILTVESLEGKQLTKEEQQHTLSLREDVLDTDPMCIINTSGSTGVPKGVVLGHRGFIDFTEWAKSAKLTKEQDILGCLSPIIFDIYSFEICLLMAQANTMLIIPQSLASFPARMLELMQKEEVSFIFWVPTIMVNIANMDLLAHISLPHLKMIWFAGEVFPTAKCNYWRKHLPEATFVNLYGPIEITLDCLYHVLTEELDDNEPIPIGIACKNTDILLLTDENTLAKEAEEAEICVRGSGLAFGYYNDLEKTAKAFTQNPLNTSYPELIYRTGDIAAKDKNGNLVFKGRKDTLIKHHGYRIELSELEHVILHNCDEIKNCACLYNDEAKAIILFYECETALNKKEIQAIITKFLPRYMIPSVYNFMEELPRNPNGKIDRQALKELL